MNPDRLLRYIEDSNGNPRPEPDLLTWAMWMELADRVIARTKVGASEVSTVFLGLDYQFGDGPPLLYETMIFPACDYCERYTNRHAALAGHDQAVAELQEKLEARK